MYKIAGIGLLALFACMVIPSGLADTTASEKLYGEGHLVVKDASGEIVLENAIHNRLVDTGEDFINDQTFQDGVASIADGSAVAAVCAYVEGGGDTDHDTVAEIDDETTTAAQFDGGNGVTGTECEVDEADTTGASTAVLVVDFLAGTHAGAAESIDAIGVCTNGAGAAEDADFSDCASSSGVLFAVFDTADVVLSSGGSATVTYTFDLTSASD